LLGGVLSRETWRCVATVVMRGIGHFTPVRWADCERAEPHDAPHETHLHASAFALCVPLRERAAGRV
jgi:DNA-binding winged helix-turn-helix (wHTH) protein